MTNNPERPSRARVRMHPERSVPAEASEMLAAGRIAHLGFVVDTQPYVIPLVYRKSAQKRGAADPAPTHRM